MTTYRQLPRQPVTFVRHVRKVLLGDIQFAGELLVLLHERLVRTHARSSSVPPGTQISRAQTRTNQEDDEGEDHHLLDRAIPAVSHRKLRGNKEKRGRSERGSAGKYGRGARPLGQPNGWVKSSHTHCKAA